MRKSLSIFFAAVLVCMVHTGSWALWGSVPSGCSQYISVCEGNDCGMTSSAFGDTTGCATYTAYKVRNVNYEPAPFVVYDCTSCQPGYTWRDPQEELTALNQYLSSLGNSSCQSVPAFGQCKEDTSSGGDDPHIDTESCLSGNAYPGVTLHENDTSGHGNHPITVGSDCATFKTWRIDFTTYGSVDVASWSIEECLTCNDGNIPREMDRIDTLGIGCYLPDIDCPQMCNSGRACPNHTDSDCNNSYPYCSGECCVECTERSHCPDDIDWTAVSSDGLVEKQTTYRCGSNLCLSEEEYRCKAGYHDSDNDPSNGLDCVANACSGDGDCDPGLHCNTATGACISGCVTDVHCSGNTPICNTSNNTCVQCTGDDHCPDSGWMSNGNNRQSYTTNVCSNNSCTVSGTEYQCINGYIPKDSEHTSDSLLECVQCTEHEHCTGDTPVCSNNVCIGGCLDDDDCSDPTPRCKTDINKCVECLVAGDCGTYNNVVPSCTNNQCSCECDSNAWRFNSTNICNEIVCHDCPPKYGEISGELPGKTSGPGATDQGQCFVTDNGSVPFEDKTGWYTINGECDF